MAGVLTIPAFGKLNVVGGNEEVIQSCTARKDRSLRSARRSFSCSPELVAISADIEADDAALLTLIRV